MGHSSQGPGWIGRNESSWNADNQGKEALLEDTALLVSNSFHWDLSLPDMVWPSPGNMGLDFQLPQASLFQGPFNSPLTWFDELLDGHQVHWEINSQTASTSKFTASINWHVSLYCLAQKQIIAVFWFPLMSRLLCVHLVDAPHLS